MTEITVYPDEDTTVDSYVSADLSAVTLTIGDTQVRLEATPDVLAALGWKILLEVDPEAGELYPVTANGRNPDAHDLRVAALYDGTQKAIAMLEDAIASITPDPLPLTEEKRTPESMERGGWFRVPPSKVWRQLTGMTFNRLTRDATAYSAGGETVLRIDTTYPYLTDEAFHAACDKEARQ